MFRVWDVHKKLIHTFNQNGWADKPLAVADIDVGKIDVELGEGVSLKMKKTHRMKSCRGEIRHADCDFPQCVL
jgi:hypothetical protein